MGRLSCISRHDASTNKERMIIMPMEMSAKKEEVDFESISSLRGGEVLMTCVTRTLGFH